jgi:starvation-inducible DNA-binding protein
MSPGSFRRTRIDVAAGARERLVPLLNASLADMIDLFNQTKHAHWNVKGPAFIALHELFDDVAERVEEHCDLLAERVVALGGTAAGTTRQSAAASRLAEYDLEAAAGERHVHALSRQIAVVAASVRSAIQQSAELGDPTTSDLHRDLASARQGPLVPGSPPPGLIRRRTCDRSGFQAELWRSGMDRQRLEDLGKLLLRVLVAGLMLFHGVDKLLHGPGHVQADLSAHGLPGVIAYGAYVGEVLAPTLILAGVWTRVAAVVYRCRWSSRPDSCTAATSSGWRRRAPGRPSSGRSTS